MKPHRFEFHNKDALVDQERSSEQPAGDIISRANIGLDEVIADLGCGTGYLSIPLADDSRYIYALDVSSEMLHEMLSRSTEAQRDRLRPIRCELPQLPLRDSSLDRVLMVNVLHEFEEKGVMVSEAVRVLRKGGRISLVDFQKRTTKRGPPIGERVDERDVIDIFKGLELVEKYSFPSFYQFEFRKVT